MKVSVKIEEDVQIELVKVAGEYQAKRGCRVSISDAIKELIKEHKERA
jgi:predicted CopG family antitoxin